jgi:hypothetical protein
VSDSTDDDEIVTTRPPRPGRLAALRAALDEGAVRAAERMVNALHPAEIAHPTALLLSRRALATSAATAQDASRAMSESARLVRMIGTRAPSTLPAASAPARKDRLLASMLPASRSGTSSTLARPATAESIFLIFAASRLIALSRAKGPSTSAPVIW